MLSTRMSHKNAPFSHVLIVSREQMIGVCFVCIDIKAINDTSY